MSQDFQEMAIEEIEQVSGSAFEIDPPVAQTTGVDYPAVVNNPPG
jgi:hypothetical protein